MNILVKGKSRKKLTSTLSTEKQRGSTFVQEKEKEREQNNCVGQSKQGAAVQGKRAAAGKVGGQRSVSSSSAISIEEEASEDEEARRKRLLGEFDLRIFFLIHLTDGKRGTNVEQQKKNGRP